MATQSEVDSMNEELKKIADDSANLWYRGAVLDTAAHIPGEMRKITGNRPDETPIADLWNDFGPIDTVHSRFKSTAFDEADYLELERRVPAFKKQRDDERMEQVSLDFVRGNRNYLSTPDNFGKLVKYLGRTHMDLPNLDNMDDGIEQLYKAGFWSVAHLEAAFKVLTKAGQLEVERGEFRNLTAKEELVVTADIRMGDFEGAINHYVRFSFDYPSDVVITNAREFAAGNPELLTKCSWFIFETMHAGELTASELREFKKHMARHPLPTIQLLNNAYNHWQAAASTRQPVVAEPQVVQPERELTPKEIEALSPAELDALIRREQINYLRSRFK